MVRARIRLGDVIVAEDGTLTDKLDRSQLRVARQREGRHLLRRNPSAEDPELIWRCSLQLCQVEEAFRTQKGAPGLVRDSTATRSGWEPACSSPSWPACLGWCWRSCHAAVARRPCSHHRRPRTPLGASHRIRSRSGSAAGPARLPRSALNNLYRPCLPVAEVGPITPGGPAARK